MNVCTYSIVFFAIRLTCCFSRIYIWQRITVCNRTPVGLSTRLAPCCLPPSTSCLSTRRGAFSLCRIRWAHYGAWNGRRTSMHLRTSTPRQSRKTPSPPCSSQLKRGTTWVYLDRERWLSKVCKSTMVSTAWARSGAELQDGVCSTACGDWVTVAKWVRAGTRPGPRAGTQLSRLTSLIAFPCKKNIPMKSQDHT